MRGATIGSLTDHLDYLYGTDPRFRWTLAHMSRPIRSRYIGSLTMIERCRSAVEAAHGDIMPLHAAAALLLADQFRAIPEREFPDQPSPSEWIKLARNPGRLHALHNSACCHLERVVHLAETRSKVRCYGAVKPRASIERKIRAYRSGQGGLDLWDLVRFRAVAVETKAARQLGTAIWEIFGRRVVRCRNYYTRPRKGWEDPYRAMHFVLNMGKGDEQTLVELQILTLTRDAVGLIDHSVNFKQTVRYCNTRHERWLQGLLRAANIADAEVNRAIGGNGEIHE